LLFWSWARTPSCLAFISSLCGLLTFFSDFSPPPASKGDYYYPEHNICRRQR
jgi:hypothetical protein